MHTARWSPARVSGEHFAAGLRRFLDRDPDLQTLSEEEKINFFSVWAERGDLAELVKSVEAHPDWMHFAWRGVAHYHAGKRDFRTAFETARRFGESPRMPQVAAGSSIDESRQVLHANPDNCGIGFQLYREQMRESKIDEALVTVRHFTERADVSSIFIFSKQKHGPQNKTGERAWRAWEMFQTAKNGEQPRPLIAPTSSETPLR